MTEGLTNLDQAVGRVIAQHRLALPMTQPEFAKTLGTSAPRVRNFEQGRQPVPLSFVWQAASVFGCTATELVSEAEELLRQKGITPALPRSNPVVEDIGRSLGF
ncbi:helix-turn-helix domain-containing protein [Nocardia rhizosphaerae]|uniref:Helix-turn-helix domain-containing protein n=1 Tax=Nocardia rhizosphaerae TaxID=1691571 RepID=A0ABV8LFF1_9NOCA